MNRWASGETPQGWGKLMIVRYFLRNTYVNWLNQFGAFCTTRPVLQGQDHNPERDGGSGAGTLLATRTRVVKKRPDLYRVLLLNDDYTPMEFVIHVIIRFFNKTEEEATRIMLHVHNFGVGECGTFTYEIAETKVTLVMDFAREHQHPLQCVMEKK